MISSRYQILSEIGQGAMGAVYHALDRLTGQDVALKRVMPHIAGVVPPANDDPDSTSSRTEVAAGPVGDKEAFYTIHPDAGDGTAGDQTLLSSGSPGSTSDGRLALAREFRLLSSLHHPNIIRVLDYGFDPQRLPYYTMERLPAPQTVLEAAEHRPLEAQMGLLIQMLQALAYLHRRGVIHRDIKPSNALVEGDHLKLLDFGIAELREQAAAPGGITGTISYMAPELLQGKQASEASDLFAIGVVAYQMLTGRHPYKAKSLTLMMVNITRGRADLEAPDLDPRLVPVLRGLLDADPENRFGNALEVIDRLSEALDLPRPRETAAIRDSFLQAAGLVGRRQEIGLLADRLGDAMAGLGKTILIAGESGAGKTRLLDELRTLALVKGALVLDGQEVRDGHSPYQGWRQPIRRLCLENPPDEDAGVLLGLVPDLAELLGRPVAAEEEADPVTAKKKLQHAVIRLLKRRERPTVVILEDLQWSGEESLELVEKLQEALRETPFLLVASFRHDERPDLPERLPAAEVLTLQRLSASAIQRLSLSMLGEAGGDEAILELLEKETEGNVFFIVEVVRALVEEAGRVDGVDTGRLPERITTGGIRRILRRRLERVPETARPLLEAAAVAGRELDLEVLRHLARQVAPDQGHVTPDPGGVGAWLRVCVEAAVLEVQGDDWRFAHDKLRQNLLKALAPEHRRRLHRMIGDALVDLRGDAPQHLAAQAFHFRAAAEDGDSKAVDRAIERLTLAGRQAVDACATAGAFDFLRDGLRLLGGQPASRERWRREMELQNELGAAYLMSKGHAAVEVRDCFERSRHLCEQLGEECGQLPVLLGLWRHHVVRGELETALDLAQRFLEAAHHEDDEAFIVLADSALGTSLMYQGETAKSWNHFESSIERYDRLPQEARRRAAQAFSYGQNPGVANLVYGACDLWCLGLPDQAVQRCRQGLELADQLDHPFSQAFANVIAAWVYQFRREYEAAGEHAARAVELSKAQGFQLFLAVGSVLLGWSLAMRGQTEKGIGMLQHTLDLLRASGSELLRPYFLALLAEAHGRGGDLEAGLDAVHEALEIAERSGQGWWLPEIHRLEGELMMMRPSPELERAEVCFEKALGLAWQRGEKSLALRSALSLAQLRHQTDALDPARPLREVHEQLTEGFDTVDMQAAALVLSMGS